MYLLPLYDMFTYINGQKYTQVKIEVVALLSTFLTQPIGF